MRSIRILMYILTFVMYTNTGRTQQLIPGDGVRITFYNITDNLSGNYFLEKDSTLRMPFLGIVNTQNRTFNEIRDEIYIKYDSIYKDPELTIQPLYRVNVLGEVRTPGTYYVTGVEKLSDLLAQAGGITSDADLDDIYITREEGDRNIDGEAIIQNGDRLSDIGIESGDGIYVSRQWWVSARNSTMIISAAAVLVTLISMLTK